MSNVMNDYEKGAVLFYPPTCGWPQSRHYRTPHDKNNTATSGMKFYKSTLDVEMHFFWIKV